MSIHAVSAAGHSAATDIKSGNQTSHGKILIVDDEPDSIEFLTLLLKDEGFEMFVATGGEEALRLMSRNCYDAVVLDVNMPELNGYDVAIRARHIKEYADVPIFFISGRGDSHTAVSAFRAGGCDFMAKPFNGEEFVARLGSHLRVRRHLNSKSE